MHFTDKIKRIYRKTKHLTYICTPKAEHSAGMKNGKAGRILLLPKNKPSSCPTFPIILIKMSRYLNRLYGSKNKPLQPGLYSIRQQREKNKAIRYAVRKKIL